MQHIGVEKITYFKQATLRVENHYFMHRMSLNHKKKSPTYILSFRYCSMAVKLTKEEVLN